MVSACYRQSPFWGLVVGITAVVRVAGFSPIPSILAYFPNASIDNCPRLWNMSASLEAASPTVLLDTVTGERVEHWVEVLECVCLW